MPQQLLDGAELAERAQRGSERAAPIRTAFEQVRGEGMTEGVATGGLTSCHAELVEASQSFHTRTGRDYYVYILASKSGVLYIGVTNDLQRRIFEHRQQLIPGFTGKYHVTRLLYFESFGDIRDAIAPRETAQGLATAEENHSHSIYEPNVA
jgi:putative endonuclease